MMPGLSYRNAALCLGSYVQKWLAIKGGEAGRLALGVHGKTHKERMQGAISWVPIEVRKRFGKTK